MRCGKLWMFVLLSGFVGGGWCSATWAQHFDIEFQYESAQIALEGTLPSRLDAEWVFEGSIPTSGISQNFTTNPGFASEIAEGMGIGPNETIDFQILRSSTLGSVLTYYNPTTLTFAPTTATITLDDNGAGHGTWIVSGNAGVGSGPGVIGVSDALGDFHSHIDFELSSGAATGAYGLLMELTTSAPGISKSNPFWLVFNYGMSTSDFDTYAVPAFQAIPEPGSLGLLALCAGGLIGFRRRRRAKVTAGNEAANL